MDCQYCKRPANSKKSNIQHELRCRANPNQISLQYLTERASSNKAKSILPPCEFCNKKYDSKIALGNHKIRCPNNPNRQIQVMSIEGKERSRIANEKKNERIWNDPGYRKRHRDSMKRAVIKYPESYTSSNRGRTKQIIYDGLKFQGQWELDFYKWAKAQGLDPKRPIEGFPYHWNGDRTYFPDFYIRIYNVYIEVKGYETDRDRAKWSQFPKQLIIIKQQQIKEIRNGTFKGIDLQDDL